MKLIIQIPCFNEEDSLPVALAELPRELPGFDCIEWLVIDDGSTDRTVEVARANGVDHIVRMTHNSGLAKVFMAGVDACLRLGADIIVNTDADNQYCAADMPKLIAPILEGKADYVVGARPIQQIDHFSPIKKSLQALGSWVVRRASGTDIPDAPSGYRAITREAAMRLNVFSEYTYTLETIIQAGQKGMAITSVPVRVNADLRPSRLVRSIGSYVKRSVFTILRVLMYYEPMKFFLVPGSVLAGLGALVGLRFVYFYAIGQGQGHVQSLILTAILLVIGFQLVVFGLMADLLAVNRKLLEDVQWRTRRLETDLDRVQQRTVAEETRSASGPDGAGAAAAKDSVPSA